MEWDLNNWALNSIIHALRPLRDGDRWRRFFRTSLWLPLPAVAALAFGIVYSMLRLGGEGCTEHALRLGLIAPGGAIFAWALGIWAATDTDRDEHFARRVPPGYEPSRRAVWGWKLILVALVLLIVGSYLWEAFDQVHLNGVPLLLVTAKLLIKAFVVAGVFVPLWLSRRFR